MVTGEHHNACTLELLWGAVALARSHPYGQIFEATQGAGWFGQQVLSATGRGTGPSVQWGDVGEVDHGAITVGVGFIQTG